MLRLPVEKKKIESKSKLDFDSLECLEKLREEDNETGIQFYRCQIDYTTCPNHYCIRNLV